jgi:hypothetical protein
LFRLFPFISLGSCNHCNLACFLWSNNFEHPLSNHGLCFYYCVYNNPILILSYS